MEGCVSLFDEVLLWFIFGSFALAFVFVFLIRTRWGGLPVGVCLCVASVGLFVALASQYHVAIFGQDAEGVIEEIVPMKRDRSAWVRFVDGRGEEVRFRCRQGVYRGPYQVGDTVPVRYLESEPTHAAIANRQSLWQPLAIGTVFSLTPLVVAVIIFRSQCRGWRKRQGNYSEDFSVTTHPGQT
jgi:hypothetical protein